MLDHNGADVEGGCETINNTKLMALTTMRGCWIRARNISFNALFDLNPPMNTTNRVDFTLDYTEYFLILFSTSLKKAVSYIFPPERKILKTLDL